MPRGSRPGERRGGRQRGTPNKKTLLKNSAVDAAAADPNITPLAFLLRLMRDENLPVATRVDIAATAAPLFHTKPKPTKGGQTDGDGSSPNEKGADQADSLLNGVGVVLLTKSDLRKSHGADAVSPLEFLQQVMTDPTTPPQLRIRAARIAAPFRHGKPTEPTFDPGDIITRDEYGFEVDQRFARKLRDLVVAQWRTWYGQNNDEDLNRQIAELRKSLPRPPPGYGDAQARGDRYRMCEYSMDRISLQPQLKLSPEDDARISHVCFRFLAFAETWGGIEYYDHYLMSGLTCNRQKGAQTK